MKRFLDELRGARKIEWILLAAAVATLLLILWGDSADLSAPRTAEEERIISVLSRIEGVGKTDVMISESGGVLILAEGAEDIGACLRLQYAMQTLLGIEPAQIEILPYGD